MGRPLVLNVWKQRMSWKQQMSSNSNWTLSHPCLNPCSLENYVLETLVRSTSNVWRIQCSAVQRKITPWRHWYAQPAESQTYTRPRVFGGQFGDRQICYQILWITEFVTLQQKSITTAVTRGHFDAWSTDQEFPIVIFIWQTRFTEIAVSRKL